MSRLGAIHQQILQQNMRVSPCLHQKKQTITSLPIRALVWNGSMWHFREKKTPHRKLNEQFDHIKSNWFRAIRFTLVGQKSSSNRIGRNKSNFIANSIKSNSMFSGTGARSMKSSLANGNFQFILHSPFNGFWLRWKGPGICSHVIDFGFFQYSGFRTIRQ